MVDIQEVNSIRLDADTRNLLDEVDTSLESVNSRRPFSPDVQNKIATAFLPDRVTASLNMEGIAVTRRQTLATGGVTSLEQSLGGASRAGLRTRSRKLAHDAFGSPAVVMQALRLHVAAVADKETGVLYV